MHVPCILLFVLQTIKDDKLHKFIYVTYQGTNVKLPVDDVEMSKHVGVNII
jgi:hypothetical protein